MTRMPAPGGIAERVLIVRLSSLGDVVHGLPVICALRARLPGAVIGWVVEDWAADLLRGHAALDHVFTVPRGSLRGGRGWFADARTLFRLRAALRVVRFECSIDVQGLTRSALAARVSGARRRIGFDGADGRQRSRALNTVLVRASKTHVIERNLELLRPLGITDAAVAFDLPACDDADRRVGEWLAASRLPAGGLALLSVGASRASKTWPLDRLAALARRLADRHGLTALLVWGSVEERAAAERTASLSAGAAVAARRFDLRELVALSRRVRLCVAPDSGVLHIAAAAGAPCVGLYGPTPVWRTGPHGQLDHAIQSPDGTMSGISVDAAAAACERRLTTFPPGAPAAGCR